VAGTHRDLSFRGFALVTVFLKWIDRLKERKPAKVTITGENDLNAVLLHKDRGVCSHPQRLLNIGLLLQVQPAAATKKGLRDFPQTLAV
jgi:hypothetical protein